MRTFKVIRLFLMFVVLLGASCIPWDHDEISRTSESAESCGTSFHSEPGVVPVVCWHHELNAQGACIKVWDDDCCEGTKDPCEARDPRDNPIFYTKDVSDYLGFQAHSNGLCTGNGSGTEQCAVFVQNFYLEKLKHDFATAWGGAGQALARVAANDRQLGSDPVFVFRSEDDGWSGTREPPRETDILVFSGGGFGHVVIAEAAIPSGDKVHIPIIEENVAKVGDYGPPGSLPDPEDPSKMIDPFCHHRVLVASKKGEKWNVDSGIGYSYAGFIRHNLAGIYEDTGWRDDRTSRAFRDAYLRFGTKLGWAFSDHNGTPFVHEVHGVKLQNFRSTDPANHFGTDGETAIALMPMGPAYSAYLLKEGFWGAYKCIPGSDGKAMGGAEYLGAPLTDEKRGKPGAQCGLGSYATEEVTYQLFENGCLWFCNQMDGKVHIHLNSSAKVDAAAAASCGVVVENNPPGADCTDDCSPGTQECHPEGSSKLRICGTPGPDACHHWLNMSCASGLVCHANECVNASSVSNSSLQSGSSSTVTIATFSGSSSSASSSGGSSASASGSASETTTNSDGPICSPGIVVPCTCGSANGLQSCSFDGMSFGACVCQESASASGSSSPSGTASSGSSSTTASSSSVPSSSSGSSSASVTASPSLSTGLRLSYTSPLCGPLHVEAWWENKDGIIRSWAPVECADENTKDCNLDCILPFPSDAPYLEFQVFLPNGEGYGNEDCYNGGCGEPLGELHLYNGGEEISFDLVVSSSGELYYLISLSGGSASSSPSGTALSGSSSATTSSSGSSSASTSSTSGSTGSSSSSGSSSSGLRLSYTSPLCGPLHVEAWWENKDGIIRSWAPVECADENTKDCNLDCILPFPSDAPYLEFQVFLPNGEGYGNEDCYNGGCGEPLGELHLYNGGEEISFDLVPSQSGEPYYLLALKPVS